MAPRSNLKTTKSHCRPTYIFVPFLHWQWAHFTRGLTAKKPESAPSPVLVHRVLNYFSDECPTLEQRKFTVLLTTHIVRTKFLKNSSRSSAILKTDFFSLSIPSFKVFFIFSFRRYFIFILDLPSRTRFRRIKKPTTIIFCWELLEIFSSLTS